MKRARVFQVNGIDGIKIRKRNNCIRKPSEGSCEDRIFVAVADKTRIYSDSQSSIHLCKNPVYHEKSKHSDIRLYWIGEKIEEGTNQLKKVGIKDNPVDIGTKVPVHKFRYCLNLLNL